MIRTRRAGFTLIELLVVISIIALLIGILLPTLAKARRSSQRVADASNQRQIGLAANFYAEDNDQYVPREGVSGDPPPPNNRVELLSPDRPPWAVVLRPYLDDTRAARYWETREFNDLFESVQVYKDPGRPKDEHPLNYVVNALSFRERDVVDRFGPIAGQRRKPAWPRTFVPFPAEAYYITNLAEDEDGRFLRDVLDGIDEGNPRDENAAQLYDAWRFTHVESENTSVRRIAPAWYDGGSNVLFFDGHVEIVREDVIRDVNSWNDGDYSYYKFITR
ncbi:MAG: prepilin-type N-terminal cleavage/methylation domain-containing protein [Planctomycetota bacterium]